MSLICLPVTILFCNTPPIYTRLTHYREANQRCTIWVCLISIQFSRGSPCDITSHKTGPIYIWVYFMYLDFLNRSSTHLPSQFSRNGPSGAPPTCPNDFPGPSNQEPHPLSAKFPEMSHQKVLVITTSPLQTTTHRLPHAHLIIGPCILYSWCT